MEVFRGRGRSCLHPVKHVKGKATIVYSNSECVNDTDNPRSAVNFYRPRIVASFASTAEAVPRNGKIIALEARGLQP